jgi:hypothetical protein
VKEKKKEEGEGTKAYRYVRRKCRCIGGGKRVFGEWKE